MYVLLLYFPEGTRNVIEACIQQSVRRLIYASSVDVVKYKGDVVDGDEDTPATDNRTPGYGDTKCRAERAVLSAHGRPLSKGISLIAYCFHYERR